MYTRETVAKGNADRSALDQVINDTILPGLSNLPGFKDLTVSGDGDTIWVTSTWTTVEDLMASRDAANGIRLQATDSLNGAILATREWVTPVSVVSSTQPPAPGLPVNVNRHRYDPTRIQEVVSFFAWVAEPTYSSSPGFRSVRMLVDRTTGEVQVESVWDDIDALEGGLARTEHLRDRASEKGMTRVDRTQRESLFYSSSN